MVSRLEDLTRGVQAKGLLTAGPLTIVDMKWDGSACVEMTYKYDLDELLARAEEPR